MCDIILEIHKKTNFSCMRLFLKNYVSTLSFLGILTLLYSTHSVFSQYVTGEYWSAYYTMHFSSMQFFGVILALYIIFLIPFYLKYQTPGKALIFYQYCYHKWHDTTTPWTKNETNAILSWVVK